jgi:hypothetical protein
MTARPVSPENPETMSASRPTEPAEPEAVPLFGTWTRIYAAVVASAVLVMALVALFSGWPY